MAIENGKGANMASILSVTNSKLYHLIPVLLRLAALLATATAAFLTGLNRQTKNTVVAVVGTTPIYQALTAKFQDNPAFVYLVIANTIATVYNLLVLLLRYYSRTKSFDMVVHIMDTVMLSLVATGAAAATSMADLAKHGNLHARWIPICDRFEAFCSHGGWALVASFAGAVFLLVLNMLSTFKAYKNAVSQS